MSKLFIYIYVYKNQQKLICKKLHLKYIYKYNDCLSFDTFVKL